jgi:hypothetical protein
VHSSPLECIFPRDSIACFRLKKEGFSLGLKQICGRILPSLISTFFSLLCNASARFFQDTVRKKKMITKIKARKRESKRCSQCLNYNEYQNGRTEKTFSSTNYIVLLTGRFDGIVSVGLILVTSLLSGLDSSVGG